MTETVKRLTDLMAGIHKKYYDESDPNALWNYFGNLRVHKGDDSYKGVSIDLYHFEGDGLPVCDGLDFDGYHPKTRQLLTLRPFCICYCPTWEQPLCLLCYEATGDSDDWEMNPADMPVGVLTRIADWIETEMSNPKND